MKECRVFCFELVGLLEKRFDSYSPELMDVGCAVLTEEVRAGVGYRPHDGMSHLLPFVPGGQESESIKLNHHGVSKFMQAHVDFIVRIFMSLFKMRPGKE